jgi:phosphomannomutase
MQSLRDSLQYDPAELAFGTSGLRGLVLDMTDLECYINSAGFLDFLTSQQGFIRGSNVLVAGDLRDSTPRILKSVIEAITDKGFNPIFYGFIPTPALAFYALTQGAPCIMITGSHIPADRNGIKFYKLGGEVLKADESSIQLAVASARVDLYGGASSDSKFTHSGMLKVSSELPDVNSSAEQAYRNRYADAFSSSSLQGKKIVYYQHSSVGRDLLVDMLRDFGAEVVPVGRSETFVPIDSENVTPADQAYFRQLAIENPDCFAILSTDGDSDRPFVMDRDGVFHRGDVLGAVTAQWCKAASATYPVSTSDAVDQALESSGIAVTHTKIGSPYVIVAMNEAEQAGKSRVVGWEVNGGFLLGTELKLGNGSLQPLPTRDAFFPMFVALLSAATANQTVAELFASLPQRFTDAGLIDNFPVDVSKAMVARFMSDTPENREALSQYFSGEYGFGAISGIDTLDGVRIIFDSGDIAHLRPSSNAPQLRIYSVANTPERAAEIVSIAIAEPEGIFRKMQHSLQSLS